jgi:DNA-directed RNA polymerase subunit L
MSLVTDLHLNKDENTIDFKINNTKKEAKFETALINGLRRTILVDIPSFAINREQVKYYKNSSVFNNDFITMRLALLSVMHKHILDKDLEELELNLVKDNKSEKIIDVTPAHFEITYKDETLKPEQVFAYTNSIICRLKPFQDINFKCFISKNTHKEGGSYYCPVSKVTYYFEMDKEGLQKEINNKRANSELEDAEEVKRFEILKRERFFKKTDDDKPLVYCFCIDSSGEMPVESIFSIGCDLFIKKCRYIKEKIESDPDEKTCEVEQSPTNMKAFDFIIFDENDTIGNLLQVYLYYDKDVQYSGYVIPHPLDNKLIVRLSLKKADFTQEDCKNKVINCLDKVIEQIEEIKTSYLEKVK